MNTKSEWKRDPFRFAMMAHLSDSAQAALCAALTIGFFAGALYMLAAVQGAAVIALVGAACVAALTFCAWRALRDEKPTVVVLLIVSLLAMLAVGAHLAMLDIKPGRYANVLEPLLGEMWNYELVTAMAWEDDAWSGVYLIICALLSRVEGFSALHAFKLIDLVCQTMCALAVMQLAKMRGAKGFGMMGAMLACLLAPTMLFNAGVWAQCDATFAMFTLWGLVLLLDDHPLPASVLWGLALGTKLQSAFVFPLLIVLFAKRRVQLWHIAVLLAAAFLCQIAIVIDGVGVESLLTRYATQIDTMKWEVGLVDDAPSVFSLMKVASVREFSGMGMYLGFACALIVAMAMIRSRVELSSDILLLGALLLAAGLPLILPQMNTRCLYLAGMLSFAAAGNARRMLAALLLEIASLCSYILAIFNLVTIPMTVLTLLAIAAAVLIALELAEAITGKKQENRA